MSSFLSVLPKRQLCLGGLALILLVIVIARWISDWGLVTIHVKDAPLGRVIASIAAQGHVRVESSLDPSRMISLDVDQVTPVEAIDMLALRADAAWRSIVLAAPKSTSFDSVLVPMKENGRVGDWITLFYPAPPFANPGARACDPALLEWKPDAASLDLPRILDEAAQKTGVMIVFPPDWAPPVGKPPGSAPVCKAIRSLAAGVGGKTLPLFFLTERGERRQYREGTAVHDGVQEVAPPFPFPQNSLGGQRGQMKPEWMEERALAQIRRLPEAERAAAKKEFDEMKSVFEQLNGLSPEERREKMRELMASPAIAEKMADRRLLRESNMTAEQRIARAVNYLGRKAAAKQATP